MFGTIRKHQTWLWAVIITLTVISFVVYFSPYSRLNNSGYSRNPSGRGTINGEPVTDQQFLNAYREVDLYSFLNTSHWLNEDRKRSEDDVNREVYMRLLLIQKEEQNGIHVSEQEAARLGRLVIARFERMGITSPQMFVEKVLQPHGLQVSDFERYIQHEVGIQELVAAYGLTGQLLTPQDAKALYQRDHQELATEAALFPASNYLASIVVTPSQVSQFYSNRLANFAIPERVVVDYVKFNVTNYLAQAQTQLSTNINDLVEMNYERLGTNAVPDAKTPEEAKAKIREQLIRRTALAEAEKHANSLVQQLSAMETNRAENLKLVAQSNGVPVHVSAPFDSEEGPKDMDVGADFVKQAFALTPDDPLAGPLPGPDGVYVIALDRRLPREIPPLDSIRDKVLSDYKHNQAMIQARAAALNFFTSLTNSLGQGKTFEAASTQAGVQPVPVPPLSISTQHLPGFDDLVSLPQLKQVAFTTQPGKAGPPLPTSEGFLVLYVKAKLPLDQAQMEKDLPNFIASVRRNREFEAFNDWFRQQAERDLRNTPVFQQRPPALGAAGAKS